MNESSFPGQAIEKIPKRKICSVQSLKFTQVSTHLFATTHKRLQKKRHTAPHTYIHREKERLQRTENGERKFTYIKQSTPHFIFFFWVEKIQSFFSVFFFFGRVLVCHAEPALSPPATPSLTTSAVTLSLLPRSSAFSTIAWAALAVVPPSALSMSATSLHTSLLERKSQTPSLAITRKLSADLRLWTCEGEKQNVNNNSKTKKGESFGCTI